MHAILETDREADLRLGITRFGCEAHAVCPSLFMVHAIGDVTRNPTCLAARFESQLQAVGINEMFLEGIGAVTCRPGLFPGRLELVEVSCPHWGGPHKPADNKGTYQGAERVLIGVCFHMHSAFH
jgi:hypothetical protein